MPAPSPATAMPDSELVPQASVTGAKQALPSSQAIAQPAARARLRFGTTPWCSSTWSAANEAPSAHVTRSASPSASMDSASTPATTRTCRRTRAISAKPFRA
jgi:hypothetical protein